MSLQTVHPVILLLEKMRQHRMDPEDRIMGLRRKIRDLSTDTYGNAGNSMLGRRDLFGGNYIHDKALQTKQNIVYWNIDCTFLNIYRHSEDSIRKLYGQMDRIRAEHRRNVARVKELEIEISRDNIQAVTILVRSPALHGGDSIQRKPTGFLDLPAELRNEIYELSGCLKISYYRGRRGCVPAVNGRCTCKDLTPRKNEGKPFKDMKVPLRFTKGGLHWKVDAISAKDNPEDAVNHQPSLTRASKQIRAETLPMYYGSMRLTLRWQWRMGANTQCFHWLRRLNKQYLSLINTVEVVITHDWPSDDDAQKRARIEEDKTDCLQAFAEVGIKKEQCKFTIRTA